MAKSDTQAGDQAFLEMFEGNAHPMWIFDTDSLRFLAVNAAMLQKYGYSREELLGLTVLAIRPGDEIERFKSHLGRIGEGVDRAGRWRHCSKDGRIIHADITTHRINHQGRPARMVLAIDVSEQVEAAARLQNAEALYRSVLEHAIVGIYIVRDMKIAYANPRLMKMFGYNANEIIGMNILDLTVPRERDAARAAMRERIISDIGVGRRIFTGLRKDGSEIILDIHNTRAGSETTPVMMGVVLDITDSWHAEAQAAAHIVHLRRMVDGALTAITRLHQVRDPRSTGHADRTAELAAAIAGELGSTAGDLDTLRKAGLVHDAGKMGIPLEILCKSAQLTPAEFALIKTHPQLGHDILQHIDFRAPVAEAVLQHHERMDGSGYPQGLKGGEILPVARILAVADALESMMSERPYGKQLDLEQSLAEIDQHAGSHYDADVCAACIRLFRDKGYRIG